MEGRKAYDDYIGQYEAAHPDLIYQGDKSVRMAVAQRLRGHGRKTGIPHLRGRSKATQKVEVEITPYRGSFRTV